MRHKFQQLAFACALIFAPVLASAANGVIVSFSSYVYTSSIGQDTSGSGVLDLSYATVYVGSVLGCTGTGTDACQTCKSLPAFTSSGAGSTPVCTDNGIYGSLMFYVTFYGPDADAYPTAGYNLPMTAFIGNTPVTPDYQTPLSANTPATTQVTVGFKWSTLFGVAGGSNSLTKNSKFTLMVGFNGGAVVSEPSALKDPVTINVVYRYATGSNYQKLGCLSTGSIYSGVCDYTVFPGDEKLYIQNASTYHDSNTGLIVENLENGPQTTPAADPNGVTLAGIRIFYKQNDTAQDIFGKDNGGNYTVNLSDGTWQSSDIRINAASNSLQSGHISGLANGTSYVAEVANVDQAGIVQYFFDPALLSSTDDSNQLGQTQAGTPQPVTGLLDDKHCFIATAAYGSGDATQVETLRKFRNRYLLNWDGGRAFVRFYYRNSPPIAQFISQREWLKALVRGTLEPIVLMAFVAFQYGLWAMCAILASAFVIFTGGVFFLRHRRTG